MYLYLYLSGTGTGGQTDGAKATFSQPTSCCTEANTVYVTDSATGTLKMITRPSGLLKYLENLNQFLSVFGVHRRNEHRANVKTFSAKEAIDVIGQVNGFFKHCISEVRKITNLKGLGHAILDNFSPDRMVIELTKISK